MRIKGLKTWMMAGLALAIVVSGPALAQQGPADNTAMMDLVIQVQQLQDEVRILRGLLEEQTIELENLSNRQRDQYLDLDQRIGELRVASPGLPASRPVTGGSATAGADSASTPPILREEEAPFVRPAIDTPSAVTALATPEAQTDIPVNSPEAEQEAYDRAFQSLKDLKYAAAAEQFQSFLDRYPGSDLADNAQYWLGESYYVTRNYDIALEAFQDLLSKYPDSPKVADGLLKIGYTHYELKQWELARAALVQVQEQYPGTTMARLAGSRLRSMKVEGHL